jgi:hypothetical protein
MNDDDDAVEEKWIYERSGVRMIFDEFHHCLIGRALIRNKIMVATSPSSRIKCMLCMLLLLTHVTLRKTDNEQ